MGVFTMAQLNKLKNSGGAGYSETDVKKILSVDEWSMAGYSADTEEYVLPSNLNLTDGDKLKIAWGDKVYRCEYKALGVTIDGQYYEIRYFGNLAICNRAMSSNGFPLEDYGITVPDTGEPFCYIPGLISSEGEDGIVVLSGTEMPAATFYTIAETIHPIDPKYLPGVCLPVVEISTEPSESGEPLTAEESAKMDAAFDSGMPCVVKFGFAGTNDYEWITFLACRIDSRVAGAYTQGYAFAMASTFFNFERSKDGWIFKRVDGA